jgi:CyaY protein
MTESEFNQRVDDIIERIEEAVDDSGANIDFETAGGILTLLFEDNSKIIINRQTPVQQIWVAAKSGGFHFSYDEAQDQWRKDSDEQELFTALSQYCSQQSGEQLELIP